ncbi:MAG: hypothetical protein HYZ28_08495 [Myxococcales bacterium]|nr:hypothetical protein [Myxococcales bacterium]
MPPTLAAPLAAVLAALSPEQLEHRATEIALPQLLAVAGKVRGDPMLAAAARVLAESDGGQ